MKKLLILFAVILLITTSTPVQAQAVTTTNSTSERVAGGVCIDLTENLSIADKGTKTSLVLKLQSFLYPKYLKEPPTGYFGVLTDAAVKQFQAEQFKDEEFVTGFVGTRTRGEIKLLTCGGTVSASTKAAETTNRTPSTVSAYDPGAWWLNPPVETGSGSNSTVKTNNTNNSTTPTSTSTPPIDCKQYEGVIPGETRKTTLQYAGWALQKYNYPISAEASRLLSTMRGDFSNIMSFARGRQGGGFGRWVRFPFNSGVVYAWPITTREYNDKVIIHIAGSENPETVEGNVIMSVSKCPGDFTSPQLLSQRSPGGEQAPVCVGTSSVWGSGIGLVVSSGNPNGYTCDLEPNSRYYLNISAGFSKPSPLENGMPTQSPGLGIGGRGNGSTWIFPGVQSADMIIYAQDYRGQGYTARPANGAPGLIKGYDAYYLENDRVAGIVAAALQQRVAACRAAIGTGAGDRGVLGGGGECRGLPTPLPAYEWE